MSAGTLLDRFSTLDDPRQAWKVVYPLPGSRRSRTAIRSRASKDCCPGRLRRRPPEPGAPPDHNAAATVAKILNNPGNQIRRATVRASIGTEGAAYGVRETGK